jgi:hypothetical protein
LELLESRQLLSGMTTPMDDMTATLALVPDSAVTARAVQSGAWSSAATWQGGVVPTAGANVLIPTGDTVTIDGTTNALHTLRIDGTLQFSTHQNTNLVVDTVVVNMQGTLVIGTPSTPVPLQYQALVTFTDGGAINTTWDPHQLSRGLISLGTVIMTGATVTPFEALGQNALAGSTTLVLAQTPTNWQVGDEIVLAGTNAKANQDEDLHIQAINGNQVTVSALAFDHTSLEDTPVYVTDLNRNIVFLSQNTTQASRHGHVMFMTAMVSLNGVEFQNLGRTDKSIPINDPRFDSNGRLIRGSGTNPRGRYAVHFHHAGVDPTMAPAVVTDCAVNGGPGWGYVNHDSNVTFANDVAYNVVGAGFVTEIGDEIGSFFNNLSIHAMGSTDQDANSRTTIQDFGHEGDGFWFQGNGLHIENNIAIGNTHAGFVFYSLGFQMRGTAATRFVSGNLPNPLLAGGAPTVAVQSVPIFDFTGNMATTSNRGLELRYQLTQQLGTERSVIDNFTAVRDTYGIRLYYAEHVTIQNSNLIGDGTAASLTAVVEPDEAIFDDRYQNLMICGWNIGVHFSEQGYGHVLTNSVFENTGHNIEIPTPFAPGRDITLSGLTSTSTVPNHYDVYWVDETAAAFDRDPNGLFTVSPVLYNNMQLYAPWQQAGYVPLAGTPAPEALQRLTNEQLWTRYGLTMGGVMPPSAVAGPGTNGTTSAPAPAGREWLLSSALRTMQTTYTLRYRPAHGGPPVTSATLFQLIHGWNVISVPIGGRPVSFLVFCENE